MSEDFAADVTSLAGLSEPVRRELYRFVVGQGRPVSRDDAAAGVGVAHHVAKFNLDKLVADGLLEVEYRRPPGRGGPGAGRPAKLYRRGTRDIEVSLPERRYDLAGRVLAEAFTIAARDGRPVGDALHAAATAAGHRIAEAAASGADGSGTTASASGGPPGVAEVLARHGYEPRATPDGLVLGNCPFHSLAQQYTELVCGMNLDLVEGVIDRLGPGRMRARLDPGPGRCCVTVSPVGASRSAGP